MELDRLPPQNLEAERAALGSMLLSPAAIPEVSEVATASDFYRATHQVIFLAIMALYRAGSPVDALTLSDELAHRGDLKKAGGDEQIREILEATPNAANARYYGGIVREKSISRILLESADETAREVFSNNYDADELIERNERRAFAIAHSSQRGEVSELRPALDAAMGRILDRRDGIAASGLMSGFYDLDALTAGFRAGTVTVLGARPGMGKTAIGMGIALHAAACLGVGTLFFSLEMSLEELAERVLSYHSRVPAHKLKVPRFMNDREWRDLEATPLALHAAPLLIDPSPKLTITQIASIARRMSAKRGIGLVVIDYLQYIDAEDKRSSRHEQVADISKRLKALSKEIGAPILALAQLNRESEKRPNRRPMMSDLGESGQIERDADLILLLHRPEYYDHKDRPGVAELDVVKNRFGDRGRVDLVFEKQLMRFSNLEPRFDPPPAY